MFVYNQTGAYHGIVRDTFKQLNMEFVDKVDYSKTKGKKIWGNSTHSVIRYATAFGRYIFDDSYGKANNIRGTLEQCIARYETDKQKITEIIINGYNEHFGNIDESAFDFNGLITSLRNASSYLKISDYKKTGECNYHSVIQNLNNAIKQIQESYITI